MHGGSLWQSLRQDRDTPPPPPPPQAETPWTIQQFNFLIYGPMPKFTCSKLKLFIIDVRCKTESIISDLLEKETIYWSSYRVMEIRNSFIKW